MSGKLKIIIAIGLLLRIFFALKGAVIYYGRPDFATSGGDTWAWISCMENLVKHGVYTIDLNFADGKFYRPPGYTFLMLPFYLLSGQHIEQMVPWVMSLQVILDTLSIYFFYRLTQLLGADKKTSTFAAAVYAFYPFVIVWAPVLYAESSSLFFLISGLCVFLEEEKSKKNYFFSGILLGISILLRLQVIFVLPAILVYQLVKNNFRWKTLFASRIICLSFGILFSYGLWPIRNLTYGEFVPAEKIVNEEHFSEDFIAFMFYVWSVKTDHKPQVDQILNSETVEWPKASYLHPGDSATLAHISHLASTCGRGFSHFQFSAGIISKPIKEDNDCTKEIAQTFDRLRKEQIKENPFHYFITVPLGNLQKAIFKNSLYGNKSAMVKLASSALFGLRTLLILLGLAALFLNKKLKLLNKESSFLILTYFSLWYFALCFGYRNIEMRYFLQTDVILLIPAAALIIKLLSKKNEQIIYQQ